MSDLDADAVLDFWFGPLDASGLPTVTQRRRWFLSSPEFDALIRATFGPQVEAALDGELDHWLETRLTVAGADRSARDRLALILLTDQFSRNIHRGTARAFAGDALALRLALDALERGDDRRLPLSMRAFGYLPLEHAEDRHMQQRCVECFEALLATAADDAARAAAADYLEHAREHQRIIERFGRFPHRNAVLGRRDTPAETAWLAGGKRFGQ